ncbi:hypothetical protein SteCoe_28781 [Stentor coeruleus]|uniref:Uncharacterized protein n=1 Tax=Stentor coeruleus TaxID=5963 RepID=A0A1R2B7D9_9CILI|nr:hypothetical protein SteCoe_28781 [Stentor coeruleus]
MDFNKFAYEKLLTDINSNQVQGLESKYNEILQTNEELTSELLLEILLPLEKTYELEFPNILYYFPKDSIPSLNIPHILSGLKLYIENILNNKPKPSKKPKPSVKEFPSIPFTEFKYRVDLNTGFISKNLNTLPASEFFQQLLFMLRLQTSKQQFNDLLEEYTKVFDLGVNVAVNDVRFLLFNWYKSWNKYDLRATLMKSLNEFEGLKNGTLPENEKVVIDDLLLVFKRKLKSMPNYAITEEQVYEKSIEGLQNIFQHYSRQQFLLGKTPTFDSIKTNIEVLTIGKFLRFFKDFGVLDDKNKQREKKILKVIQKAFVLTAEFGKTMYENHFIQSLDLIANAFYDKEYDEANNTNWSGLPLAEKRLKFFKFLGCDNKKVYSQKLKNPYFHFGPGSDRIPDYDLGKKYKYKTERLEEVKSSIELWKKSKIQQAPVQEVVKPVRKIKKKEEKKTQPKKIEKITLDGLRKLGSVEGLDCDFDDLKNLVDSDSEDEPIHGPLATVKSRKNY